MSVMDNRGRGDGPDAEPVDLGVPPSGPPPRTRRFGNVLLGGYIGIVVVGTLLAVLFTATVDEVTSSDLLVFGVIAATAVTYDVIARRIERVRRRTNVGPFFTMNSVWTFCCAVILPTWLTALFVVVAYTQEEVQARLANNPKPVYRVLFNMAAVALPCLIVHHLAGWSRLLSAPGTGGSIELPAAVVGGMAAYTVTNAALVIGVLVIARRSVGGLRTAMGSASDILLEVATLALGALLALAVWQSVWFVVLVPPILVLLQRIALVGHLESAASSDGKTGLLNAAAWSHVAERELVRLSARQQPATVMIVDLDHFKQVNDVYGYLAGDAVLRAVADCMTATLRDRDLLSRFGGEEFVALLSAADGQEALRVAERLRTRIADVVVEHRGDPVAPVTRVGGEVFGSVEASEQIRVTVSIGLASYPHHGDDLTNLLTLADAALYSAKHAGRNRVHISA